MVAFGVDTFVQPRRLLAMLCALVLALLPSVSFGQAASTQSTGWIIGYRTLANLLANDTDGSVARMLNRPNTYVVMTRGTALPTGWTATPVQTFTDADALVNAVEAGDLLPGTAAVLLDIERWQYTPQAQQLDPGSAYARAAAAAHAHGLQLIATPAMDLVSGLGRRPGESPSDAYLRLGLPAVTGAYADVFELQSQSLEFDPATFAATLSAAAAQVRAVNPDAVIFGGVSTNQSGRTATAAQIANAVDAAPAEIGGYWLNDPAGSGYCPKCTGPYPSVAVQFLSELETNPNV